MSAQIAVNVNDVSDLLAKAVSAVRPEAIPADRGLGDRGVYADFDAVPPLSARDLPAIERELKRLIAHTGRGDPAAARVVAVSGVYPDGDESKPMRSRVSAVAFESRSHRSGELLDLKGLPQHRVDVGGQRVDRLGGHQDPMAGEAFLHHLGDDFETVSIR